jgi:hypothetical protein
MRKLAESKLRVLRIVNWQVKKLPACSRSKSFPSSPVVVKVKVQANI